MYTDAFMKNIRLQKNSSLSDVKIFTDYSMAYFFYINVENFFSFTLNNARRNARNDKINEGEVAGKEIKSAGTCGTRHLPNCAISETPGRVIRPRVQPHGDAHVRCMSRQSERFEREREREISSSRPRSYVARRNAISDAMI